MTAQESNIDEIIFVVEEAPEGGYVARALGASIITANCYPARRFLACTDSSH